MGLVVGERSCGGTCLTERGGIMGCLGWLMLLPLVVAYGLTVWVVRACNHKGSLWRILGVLASLVIGGICIQVGYWVGIEGSTEGQYQVTYPVFGWIAMISGGLIALIGTGTAIFGRKDW